ncbi:MAG: metal ABC transporter permease [Alphaproteobacteria bacterium]
MIAELFRILTFQSGYNTSVVLAGVTILGLGGGVVGSFVLLRRRALMSDSISHSTLPGVGIGFLTALVLGGTGRELPIVMLGAVATATVGILAVQWIRDNTRLAEDAAIGTVLSVFYGLGIVIFSYIQTLDVGSQAGLTSFLLGTTAALRLNEAWIIGGASALVTLASAALFKEFRLLCFDPEFAAARGYPVARLDLALMALLLCVVAIGLKTVGMVLIIALVIVPPVAARFWTERLTRMVWAAALIGGLSCWLGAALSALLPNLPSGSVIVLTAGGFFLFSFLFAPARGLLASAIRHIRFRWRLALQQGLVGAGAGEPPSGVVRRFLRWRGHLSSAGGLTERGREAAREAEAALAALQGAWPGGAGTRRRA